jgi:peptidoglycan glycosyltransferase
VNKRIRTLAIGLMVCYVALFISLQIPQMFKSKSLNANPSNTRQVEQVFDKPRGNIITADGVVIARTVPAKAGDRFKYQREYPRGELFASVTGYFTLANGASQIERVFNDTLSGKAIPLRDLGDLVGRTDPTGDVYLTIRADYQELAAKLLGKREGSIVMLDPRTGAVLALYSWPTYDPNLIATHNSKDATKQLEKLFADKRKPLLANAYQERYMPGSTFKLVTTSTALKTGVVTPDTLFADEKEYLPPQTTDPIENYGSKSCGGDLREVFRRSCNTPFARIAVQLGGDRFAQGANDFGLNEAPPFDLPSPAASFVSAPGESFDDQLPVLAQRGFGAESVQLTPLQLAMVSATIANGGSEMAPYVVARTADHNGGTVTTTKPKVWKLVMTKTVADTMVDLMIGVVKGPNGTAQGRFSLPNGIQVAAKTGTAQLNPKGQEQRSHAWITAFAPAKTPQVVVAVMLKGVNAVISAGTGGRLAGPIANQLLRYAILHP